MFQHTLMALIILWQPLFGKIPTLHWLFFPFMLTFLFKNVKFLWAPLCAFLAFKHRRLYLTVIFNASCCHGQLTFHSMCCFCISFSREREEEREGRRETQECWGVPLSSSHLHLQWGRKGGRGEGKQWVDHMSSWLSNSKLKRRAISWSPISRKLVLSVRVTPLGGGEGGGKVGLEGYYCEKQREGKLYRDCHVVRNCG